MKWIKGPVFLLAVCLFGGISIPVSYAGSPNNQGQHQPTRRNIIMGKAEARKMKEEFKTDFNVKELPVELDKLIDFDNIDSRSGDYSKSFTLGSTKAEDKPGDFNWSNEKSFLDRIYPFAQATASGSDYAIWDDGSGRPLGQMPVVVFGDEGGFHVVAENILQLMRALTYDTEVSVNSREVLFFKDDDDYKESKDHKIYQKWLKKEFGVDPVNDPDEEIVKPAQKKHEQAFLEWMKQYYNDD